MERKTTVERVTRPWGRNGKECEIEITRTYGLKTYICEDGAAEIYGPAYVDDGKKYQTERETLIDGGEKLGCARCRTLHPLVEPTPEERAAGRKHIQEVLTQVLVDQGIW